MIKFILLILMVTIGFGNSLNSVEEVDKKSGPFLHIKKIYCPYNEMFMEDVICSLRPEDQKLGRLNFAATLTKTIHLMWLEVSTFQRNGGRDYEYSNGVFGDDICALAKNGEASHMFSLMPGLYEKVKHMVHPCPYYAGRYEVPEYVQDIVRYADITLPMRLGDYKFVFRLHDENNNTFAEMSVEFCFD